MHCSMRLFLSAGVLLAALPAWGSDALPQLPSGGQQNIASVSSIPQTLTVTCYLGNPNDGNNLGSITVNNPAAAGPTCNSFNYSCQGRCFGCYADFDMSDDVCVDNFGRKYLR